MTTIDLFAVADDITSTTMVSKQEHITIWNDAANNLDRFWNEISYPTWWLDNDFFTMWWDNWNKITKANIQTLQIFFKRKRKDIWWKISIILTTKIPFRTYFYYPENIYSSSIS